MYSRKYWLGKVWLYKCLKGPVSKDPETENTANGSKHCCNLNAGAFVIFINH